MHSNNIPIKDFKQLNVWKLSIAVSKDIYAVSKNFPSNENFALTDQIHRSVNSIGANIAEGNAYNLYPKKEISFILIAVGSTNETRSWLTVALNNGYISQKEYDLIDNKLLDITKMLYGYVNKVKQNIHNDKYME